MRLKPSSLNVTSVVYFVGVKNVFVIIKGTGYWSDRIYGTESRKEMLRNAWLLGGALCNDLYLSHL